MSSTGGGVDPAATAANAAVPAAVTGRKHSRTGAAVRSVVLGANVEPSTPAAAAPVVEEDEEADEGEGEAEEEGDGDDMAGGGGPRAVGRRVRLTLGQKREVVDLAASKKFTHRELAEKFRVGRTTITNICRQEELIRTETDSADATKKKRKTTKCSYDLRALDECLHKWRMEVRVSSPDTKLTGTVLQQKAMDIACKILRDPYAALPDRVAQALAKFTASNGWLDGYRTRFGSFSSKQLHGEQSAIKNVDVQTRLRELHHSLRGVDLEDIWTGSEFAVAFKPPTAGSTCGFGPDAGNAQGNGAANGSANGNGSNARGRLTVSLFVSAAGEKFDLQVIGTDRSPVLLAGVDTQQTYNIQYGSSKTGWQVAHTTVSYLKALNALAKARKRTFRVILDSAVPHVKAAMILDSQGDQRTFFVYDHLQLYLLPPNLKPPRFHPCHLGVIQAFKARFRFELVETLFAAYRQSVLAHGAAGFHPLRLLHTKNVFHWLYVSLHSLDRDLIQQCWVHSGLLPTQAIATLSTAGRPGAASTGANTASALPSTALLCRDLQKLLGDIAQLAPDFLRWLGVDDPPNAVAFVELEGNAAVTDPGIDEVQLIRSVLQKHGFLSTKKLDEASHAAGQCETPDDVAPETGPRHEEVLVSVEILKNYLRLSGDNVPGRAQAVVELNKLKRAVRAALMHEV